MAKVDLLVPPAKMEALDLLVVLDPVDSPELWDSPDPRESLVRTVRAVRKEALEPLALLVLLAKMVMLVLLDLLVFLDLLERRESRAPTDPPDSRVFPDPKVLLVRLASLVIRVVLVRLDPTAHLDQEVTEVSPVSAVSLAVLAQWEAVVLLAPLVTMEPRESLVLVVSPAVRDPPVCRECPVSAVLLVCPVSRERE
ncbi:hypothetical protein OYC64_001891 [Pagothenia borchgrevinki]|uniref:Uncharacterized protein n=1 Tax=Pagothenia borchgrevinki TaxID=8213 RepID=A0ABD2GDI0_PAGBO